MHDRVDGADSETTSKVYKDIYKDKLNIVLIGMPGCGKTTVGRRLSEEFDKEFVDTDDLIVNRSGRQITDIFAKDGEEYFRDLESEVVHDVSAEGGKIIATGGGAVLRDANVDALRSNGILVFLDRPLEDLIPTDDRPLASDKEMIKKRYEERYDRYMSVSDIRVTDTDKTEGAILESL
ncbi:MAG: shikimate kinase [Lachnospiraceae bacterium]|nr:shikimate kinase [Lachnospiraceae bacterium]